MRIEQKNEEERRGRKGLTVRTIVMVIWLALSFGLAYFLTEYMITEGYLDINNLMYNLLGLPRIIPPWGAQLMIMFVIVMIFQIIFWLGFAWMSPEGRRKTGEASMVSRNKDPFDNQY